ncbi:MAG: hypothetical protein HKN58_07910 [Xanthomonadales bacterium]|nr:hypothetical protein [Xanthomonadales bacterium]
MFRAQPRALISGTALLAGFCACAILAAEQDLDILYAERLPLATESLLLDITERPGGGYVAVGERGHVVFSEDGQAWRQADVVPTRTTLTTVASAGDRLWAAGHDAVIITSGDRGLTWTLQFRDRERQQSIMDLNFTDENNGYALGSYGLALVTGNGGEDWDDSLVNEEDWHNNALLVEDELMLVAGEAGFSYRSLDGGLSWETIEMPYPGSMFGVVRSGAECFMVFGLRGNAQESCDGGETWDEIETGTQLTIAGGVHAPGRVVLVGNSGLVLVREDGGEFEVHGHSSGVDFAEVMHVGEDQYLLVGEGGIHRFPETEGPEG